MANEISHRHSATGETLYFTIRNTARQMWNTAGTPNFETLTVANWGDYDVALSESPASSYFFAGTFPAISGNMVAGWYWVDVFKRAGGSPAISDVLQASYFGYWDGTTFKWWADDTVALAGGVQSATDLKDFADDGYDPSTNKVQGVVTVDTVTTLTNDPTGVGTLLTRLSSARAGYLDNLSAGAAALQSDITTLLGRLTSSRAGYLDNLSGGAVALQSDLQSIQNNTRCVRVVPTIIERPDSGTQTYRIELLLYDDVGNMEAPDSAPTVALVDQGGTDLSARLDSATMALVSTGRYRCVYTASDTDDLEQLVWAFSVVEGGSTRVYGNTSIIVDTTAADFTASDRTKLDSILTDTAELQTDLTNGGRLDLLIDAILADTNELQTDLVNGGRLDLLIDAIKAVTDSIGATGTGLSAIPWNAAWDAEVQSEAADAITAAGLSTLSAADIRTALGMASNNLDAQITLLATAAKMLKYFQLTLRSDAAIATDNATELTAINANGGSGAGAFVSTTDSQQSIRDNLSGGGGGGSTIVVPGAEFVG